MAVVRPYRALRFTKAAGDLKELVCPPYDIISEEQRKQYLLRNPHNVIRLELPREGADVYAAAGETLKSWIQQGILRQDDRDSLYIYEESFSLGRKQYSFQGIICQVRLEEFSKNVVLPHEETLSKAKTDRFMLMSATNCNFSQIYCLYQDDANRTASRLQKWTAGQPDIAFTDDSGVDQKLWVITDPAEIGELVQDFEARKLYIADGHHRYETALRYRDHLREQGLAKPGDDADYVMMALVDIANPGLVVFPTHRIVRNIPAFDGAALLEEAACLFDVRKLDDPALVQSELDAAYDEGKKAFGYFDKEQGWNLLVLKAPEQVPALFPEKSEALALLDVTVLHSLILERQLGISKEKLADQTHLTYTRSFEEAHQTVLDGEADCCFIMNPTKVEEIAAVAAAGEKMPQKSTYFYPKLITGLVMNKFL